MTSSYWYRTDKRSLHAHLVDLVQYYDQRRGCAGEGRRLDPPTCVYEMQDPVQYTNCLLFVLLCFVLLVV